MATKFDHMRFGLELQREFLINKLEQLKTSMHPADERRGDGNNESGEQANQTLELEMRRALEKHIRDQLVGVEHALHKFDQGTYGLCDFCRQPIETTRLEALPQANLCLSCKAQEEKKAKIPPARQWERLAYSNEKVTVPLTIADWLEGEIEKMGGCLL